MPSFDVRPGKVAHILLHLNFSFPSVMFVIFQTSHHVGQIKVNFGLTAAI